jgi:hypothetical protein
MHEFMDTGCFPQIPFPNTVILWIKCWVLRHFPHLQGQLLDVEPNTCTELFWAWGRPTDLFQQQLH